MACCAMSLKLWRIAPAEEGKSEGFDAICILSSRIELQCDKETGIAPQQNYWIILAHRQGNAEPAISFSVPTSDCLLVDCCLSLLCCSLLHEGKPLRAARLVSSSLNLTSLRGGMEDMQVMISTLKPINKLDTASFSVAALA